MVEKLISSKFTNGEAEVKITDANSGQSEVVIFQDVTLAKKATSLQPE